ncbi:MAG: NADH-quinone oxidoreductase subunit N [Acidobacteriaceae bacterium]|nr:NADH-quinone oxidoreductase subunit N [Acidobacteriaceae bacterium]
MSTNLLAILPEVILTITGVIVMMAEPMIPVGTSRKALGWLTALGTALAGGSAILQHRVVDSNGAGLLSAFYGTVQVDNFSVFFHLLIAAIVIAVVLASLDYFDGPVTHAGEYFALVCFGATGMMLMTCSVELLLVFIGLEISSIATYILAGFRKGQATASESALKYFLLGSFATAFTLYGIALAFGATGSTSLAVLALTLHSSMTPTLAVLSIAMMMIGFGFKVSAAPFHVWTPDVYQGAPAPVVALMSTAPKAAVFAVLLRVLFNGAPELRGEWLLIILVFAVASMCIGNFGALMQKDVKRLLAYSSIAHAGYLLVGFVGIHQEAVSTACFYTAAYAAMNVGALLVITQLGGYEEKARTIDDFTGMGLKRPVLASLLGFFLISMIGIPFTGGFFGKFYVFSTAVHSGMTWLAIVGLANSGIACFYYLRLLIALFSRPVGQTGAEPAAKVSPIAVVAVAACALGTLALGIVPGRVLNLLQRSTPTLVVGPVLTPDAAPGPVAETPVSAVR